MSSTDLLTTVYCADLPVRRTRGQKVDGNKECNETKNAFAAAKTIVKWDLSAYCHQRAVKMNHAITAPTFALAGISYVKRYSYFLVSSRRV